MKSILGALLALLIFCGGAAAELTPEQRRLNLESFDRVWQTVRDRHWDPTLGGLDWDALRLEQRPKVEHAATMDEARTAIGDLLARLRQSHFGIIPGEVYSDANNLALREGSLGLDARVIDGQAIVVRIDPDSAAARAAVLPGWIVERAGGRDLAPILARLGKAREKSAQKGLILQRAAQALLSADTGATVQVAFRDARNQLQERALTAGPPRGEITRFGNLPPQHVWTEARIVDSEAKVGYLAFNLFLDPVRVMGAANDLLASCLKQCQGVVIDLRGNGGGIGAMSMGLAGWFVSEQSRVLGTMHLRQNTLKFAISPRARTFDGALAILVDSGSASTSEIFAGGLKDLGRARVFGERTAAAALPSVVERLPNGDGFQYAIANYISEGGQPLEGIGVTPDVEAPWARPALLAGHDPALDAALAWIRRQPRSTPAVQ